MSKNNAYRTRFDFSKIPATIQIPNLIEVQKRSYERFLQMDRLPSERDDAGLQAVFQSVFPISDFRNVSQLEFVDSPSATGSASADTSRVCITCAPPARTAARPSSPIPFIPAMCCARSAAPTTRTLPTSATSAATRSACS